MQWWVVKTDMLKDTFQYIPCNIQAYHYSNLLLTFVAYAYEVGESWNDKKLQLGDSKCCMTQAQTKYWDNIKIIMFDLL